ncbi:MAG: radical SAM protein [Acidobacteriota bacterium]
MNLRSLYYDFLALQGIFLNSSPRCGPRVAQINISDNCNLDCVICNRSCMGVSGLLDARKVITLVKELYELGTQEIYYHGFGEPACHPGLPEMVDHVSAHSPKLRQHLITNGTWNSPGLLKAIVANKVRTRFSLHAGDTETWKRIHPYDDPDNFIQAADNLRHLTERMPEYVEVLYVLCNANYLKIDEMVDFAGKNGVRKILFRPMRLFKDRQGQYMNDSLLPNEQEFQRASDLIAEYQKRLRGRITVQSVPFEENSYDPQQERPSSRAFYLSRSCYIGYVLTVIERDGNVWGCLPESSDNQPLGNIHKDNFREIWYGEKYRTFRRKQLFINKACLDSHGCHSYCQHLDTNVRLNLIKPWRKWISPAGKRSE